MIELGTNIQEKYTVVTFNTDDPSVGCNEKKTCYEYAWIFTYDN